MLFEFIYQAIAQREWHTEGFEPFGKYYSITITTATTTDTPHMLILFLSYLYTYLLTFFLPLFDIRISLYSSSLRVYYLVGIYHGILYFAKAFVRLYIH